MENAGNLREGTGSSNLTPCSWIMKELLETASPSHLTPSFVKGVIDSYSGTNGGTTSAGKIYKKIHWKVLSLYLQSQAAGKLPTHLFMKEIALEEISELQRRIKATYTPLIIF